jgi:signal transduction histidine kinase
MSGDITDNSQTRSQAATTDIHTLLDAMGQGLLVFDTEGKVILDNAEARDMLKANMAVIRDAGWSAVAELLDSRRSGSLTPEEARTRAFGQKEPVRFSGLLSGIYVSCSVAVMKAGSRRYTLLTLERPDWTALTELLARFRFEANDAITSASGHADLIMKMMRHPPKAMTVEQMAERARGFAGSIAEHMERLNRLMAALYRLELIRTNQVGPLVREKRQRIVLNEFVEDYLEEVDEKGALDPTHTYNFRERLMVEIPGKLHVAASPPHVTQVLTDLLRNALMYSPKDAGILIRAQKTQQGQAVQIDVVDEGYGIREKEADKVFAPFQRTRQPQVLAEFGYGISLYLCKAEIEAMGGRIWYESEEGVGTAISVKLPAWAE